MTNNSTFFISFWDLPPYFPVRTSAVSYSAGYGFGKGLGIGRGENGLGKIGTAQQWVSLPTN